MLILLRRPGDEPGSIAWKATMLAITPASLLYSKRYDVGKSNNSSSTFLSGVGFEPTPTNVDRKTLSGVILKSGAFERSAKLTLRFLLGVIFNTSPVGKTWEMKFASTEQPDTLIYLFE